MDSEKRAKTNPLQWSTFLDFAEVNPEILTKKFQGINGRKTYEEKWAEIVTTLNSIGYQNKPVAKWQKVCKHIIITNVIQMLILLPIINVRTLF